MRHNRSEETVICSAFAASVEGVAQTELDHGLLVLLLREKSCSQHRRHRYRSSELVSRQVMTAVMRGS